MNILGDGLVRGHHSCRHGSRHKMKVKKKEWGSKQQETVGVVPVWVNEWLVEVEVGRGR